MDLKLAGSVVVITGGTDGLGAALAELLVEEKARVAICGRDRQRLSDTEARLTGAGGEVVAVQADVTVPDDLARFVAATVERWQRIDGLVNNAGRAAGGPFEKVTDADWVADLELKVLAAVRLIRLALPHLRVGGGGSIVNVLNTGSKAPGPQSLPTTASRAVGLAITKSLSKELGPSGIRVNAVLVGLVESGQWRRQAEAMGRPVEALYEQMGASGEIPLRRVGRDDEFADLVAYLLSDRSSYVSGSAINLDGGASPVL